MVFARTTGRAAAGVALLFLAAVQPAQASFITYSRFEEGAGMTFADSSGNGHTGTLIGGAAFQANVPVGVVPQTGASNVGSLLLDGSSGYGRVPDAATLRPSTGITLEAYFRLDAAASTSILFGRQFSTGTANSFQLGLRPNLFFGLTDVGGVPQTIDTAFAPALGRWYHVAGTSDGTTMRLYIDGAEIGSTLFAGPIGYPGSNPILIGADDDGSGRFGFFRGGIDEVRISDTALAPREFLNAPQVVPEPSSLLLLTAGLVSLAVGQLRVRRRSTPPNELRVQADGSVSP